MAFAPFPDAQYLSDAARTEGEMKTGFENWLLATKQTSGNDQVGLTATSATLITAAPYDGNRLLVGQRVVTVPPAGWTLSNAGLTANKMYLIGAVDAADNGVITLQAFELGAPSTVVADTETGMPTITGTPHGNRVTYLGQARTTATAQFDGNQLTARFHGGSRILFNGEFLSGYRTDVAPQLLIGVNTVNEAQIAPLAPSHVVLGANAGGNIAIGSNALGDIYIGSGLAGAKSTYVTRLSLTGSCTIADQQPFQSGAFTILYPNSGQGQVHVGLNCNLAFNATSGTSLFQRTVRIMGDLSVDAFIYRTSVGVYNFPDFVFEQEFTGGIKKFVAAPGAREYTGLMPLAEVEAHAREHWQLPFHEREDGRVDLYRRSHDTLAELERIYLHLFEIDRRLTALEDR